MSYAHKWQPMFALTRHASSVHLFLYFYSFYSFFWLRFAFRPKFLNYLLVVLFVPECDVFLFFFFSFSGVFWQPCCFVSSHGAWPAYGFYAPRHGAACCCSCFMSSLSRLRNFHRAKMINCRAVFCSLDIPK